MLGRFEGFCRWLSRCCEWIAIVGLLVVMAVTCVDVIGAKAFRLPVPGALDIVILSQALAIAFAAAITLVHGRHIRVEFLLNILPKPAQRIVNIIMLLIGLGLFIMIISQLYDLGRYFQKGGEVSMEIGIPLYPVAYGIAIAGIPVCLVFIVELLKSFSKSGGKWTQLP